MIKDNSGGTIISDMNGIIFSFDKNFDIQESENIYFEILRSYPNGEDLVHEYTDGKIDVSLETEARVISDILGTEQFIINRGAISHLVEQSRDNKVVFVSLSKVETTKKILTEATKYLSTIKQQEFLYGIDIYNMNDYGSKKDKDSWKKIFKQYDNIKQIYEDKPDNLNAAEKAAKELGHFPEVFTKYI